jgi:hypothetical protein
LFSSVLFSVAAGASFTVVASAFAEGSEASGIVGAAFLF